MYREFFKTILAGILVAVALIILPIFLIRVMAFFLLIGAAFRLLGFGRGYGWRHKFKNMTQEERGTFKQKFACHHPEYNTSQETVPNA
jgi:hypothetical protein